MTKSCDVVKFFTNLKCSLMPYIFQKSVEAHEEGTPVMRPMVFEFMNDPAVPYLDQQYMLGDALLVAPVFREDKVAQYYLPEGTWTELLTGETKEGGRWYPGNLRLLLHAAVCKRKQHRSQRKLRHQTGLRLR